MNQFIDNEKVEELKESQNIMYVFDDSEDFSLTQFKVLRNFTDKGYAKCAKSIYNGKIKLTYFSSKANTLDSVIRLMDLKNLLMIMENALMNVIETKKNGLLLCSNVDFSPDKIFVDLNSKEVEMIYVPLEATVINPIEFEKKMITDVADIVSQASRIPTHIAERFCTEFLIENNTLEEAYSFITEKRETYESSENVTNFPTSERAEPFKRELLFTCLEANSDCEFLIRQEMFVIGKKASAVNGYIGFNSAISRQHCKIIYAQDKYYIIDLGSVNGTYVNEQRINPNEKHEIKNGDIVRLANTVFSIAIK